MYEHSKFCSKAKISRFLCQGCFQVINFTVPQGKEAIELGHLNALEVTIPEMIIPHETWLI